LTGAVIEIHTFRLQDGIDEATFLEADRKVQTEFIPNHPGFVRRTTARGESGAWAVVVLWGSQAAADESAALGASDPVVAAFNGLIDAATYRVERYEELPG
jgi:hypothetical protein